MTASDLQPTGRRNARMRQTVGDMVRSMAVVLAVVALLVLVNWRAAPDPVRVVDVAPVVALAGMQAAFPLMAPDGLPASWRATSARWQPTAKSGSDPVLHIGYVTPSDQYAQVSQSTNASVAYLDEQSSGGAPQGQSVIGRDTWVRLATQDRRSLVLTRGGVTMIASGSASWEELETLAASLAPVAQASG